MVGVAIAAAALAAARSAADGASPALIVFSATPGDGGLQQLFRIETTGAGIAQITKGERPASQPAFTADGKRILFARLGEGIFSTNLDGSDVKRLTSGARDIYPVMSPDGKRIAFLRAVAAQWRLYVMSASGGGARRLPEAPPAGRPSWSADSKSIFSPAAAGFARIDPRTGRVQKRFSVRLDAAVSQNATVAPNGRTFAFVGTRPPTGPPDCGESHCPAYALYVAAAATGQRRRVAPDAGGAGWSPDSKTIVFTVRGTLTLDAVASGHKIRLKTTPTIPQADAPPAWQPR
jgi:Tol biopolymer transport system component